MISPLVHLGDHVEVTALPMGTVVTRGTLTTHNLPLVVVKRDDDGTMVGFNVQSHNVKRIPS